MNNLPTMPDVQTPFVALVSQGIGEFLDGCTPGQGLSFAPYTTTPTPPARVGGLLGPHLETDLTKAGEFYRDRSDFTVANDPVKRCLNCTGRHSAVSCEMAWSFQPSPLRFRQGAVLGSRRSGMN